MIRPLGAKDPRVGVGLFTLAEAAYYLDVPPTTFHRWARPDKANRGSAAPPLVYVLGSGAGHESVPFVGLAEGYVLRAFRAAGVSMQRIRPALERLETEIGVPYALASGRLYTDGCELLYDYAREQGSEVLQALTVVRSGQNVFPEIVEQYLRLIHFDEDQWPFAIQLPAFREEPVIVDVNRAFGRPLLLKGAGVRVEDILERWLAGEPIADIGRDFTLSPTDCEELIRVAYKRPRAA